MTEMELTVNTCHLRRPSDWGTPLNRCCRDLSENLHLSDCEAAALRDVVNELRFPVCAQLVRALTVQTATLTIRITPVYEPSDVPQDQLDLSLLRLGDWGETNVDVQIHVSDIDYARYLTGDRFAGLSCGRLKVTLAGQPDTEGTDASDAADGDRDDSPTDAEREDSPAEESQAQDPWD